MDRLSAESLLARLVREGLLSREVVDAPGFRIVHSAARVECFEFIGPNGTGLVVKRGLDRDGRAAVRREGEALRELARTRGAVHLHRALPAVRQLDRNEVLLVEDRVPGRGRLDDAIAGGLRLPPFGFRDLGRAIAELHRGRSGARADGARESAPPWPFALASPPPLELLQVASPASLEMLRLVRQFPELHRPLEAVAGDWRPADRIHGDLRWENILIERRGGGITRLRVIDWEASRRGDAAWDLGAFLGESLRVWLFADRILPPAQESFVPAASENGTIPALSAVRPFWLGYREASRGTAREAGALLERAVRFSPVWLLGRVYELAETIPALDAPCIQSLQVAANIFADPGNAAHVLFRCGEA